MLHPARYSGHIVFPLCQRFLFLIALLIVSVSPAIGAEPGWSLKPLVKPAVPQGSAVAGNPLDAFIDARLAEKGLSRSPPADRRTLIRRVDVRPYRLAADARGDKSVHRGQRSPGLRKARRSTARQPAATVNTGHATGSTLRSTPIPTATITTGTGPTPGPTVITSFGPSTKISPTAGLSGSKLQAMPCSRKIRRPRWRSVSSPPGRGTTR